MGIGRSEPYIGVSGVMNQEQQRQLEAYANGRCFE